MQVIFILLTLVSATEREYQIAINDKRDIKLELRF